MFLCLKTTLFTLKITQVTEEWSSVSLESIKIRVFEYTDDASKGNTADGI